MISTVVIAVGLLSAADLVAGHCALVGVAGNNGIQGTGLNIVAGVNRNSQIPTIPASSPNNPEADTSVFGHPPDMCGQTAIAGSLKSTSSIMSAISKMANIAGGLPTVQQGGQLTTTMHIVNADGHPNYMADIDTTGTGSNFQPINIVSGGSGTAGILGDQGLGFDITQMPMNMSVVLQMPNSPCTGTAPDGTTGMCLLRVYNNAAAGGFGGCTAVIMGGGSGSGTNSSAASSTSSSVTSNTKDKREHARQLVWV